VNFERPLVSSDCRAASELVSGVRLVRLGMPVALVRGIRVARYGLRRAAASGLQSAKSHVDPVHIGQREGIDFTTAP
jgi:hypothetical protein